MGKKLSERGKIGTNNCPRGVKLDNTVWRGHPRGVKNPVLCPRGVRKIPVFVQGVEKIQILF